MAEDPLKALADAMVIREMEARDQGTTSILDLLIEMFSKDSIPDPVPKEHLIASLTYLRERVATAGTMAALEALSKENP